VAEKEPLVFDTILISPPPSEVSTEMLRDLPIKELTAKPAFCFLWVRDSREVELCSDIMQEWGFRSVERMAWFAAGSLTRETQSEVESLDLPEAKLFPMLKDLGFPDQSSELGLCVEDFLSFTPLESGNGQATLSHCMATTTWGAGGCGRMPEQFRSNYFPGCLEPFHCTVRFCLVGINGKIKR
jgi:MT-A70